MAKWTIGEYCKSLHRGIIESFPEEKIIEACLNLKVPHTIQLGLAFKLYFFRTLASHLHIFSGTFKPKVMLFSELSKLMMIWGFTRPSRIPILRRSPTDRLRTTSFLYAPNRIKYPNPKCHSSSLIKPRKDCCGFGKPLLSSGTTGEGGRPLSAMHFDTQSVK